MLFIFFLGLALIPPVGTGHAAQATLAWDPNTEADIAGYKVYYGAASKNYGWSVDVGKVTTFTVPNLNDGVTYYFAATAYNTAKVESTFSGEVSKSTCTYSISPPSQSLTQSGGTGTVSVSTQSTCPWTASSGSSWLTITSGGSGTGNGTVQYSVAANTSASSRTASSTIAKSVFTVNQAGAYSSTFTITASAGTGGAISPAGAVSVSSGAGKSFAITPSTNYRISSVLVDGASVGAITSYTFSNVTANHTISASFTANTANPTSTTYTITSSAGTGGSISPSGAVSAIKGTSKTFTIRPNAGYRISRVLVDGRSVGRVSNYTFSNVTANHSVSAQFRRSYW
jgi:hypothetical protein